jgi:hypothetical protein
MSGRILPAASSDLRERVVNESQRNLSIAWMRQDSSTDDSYFVSTSSRELSTKVRLPRKSDT